MSRAAIVDAFLRWAETAKSAERAKAAAALVKVYFSDRTTADESHAALQAMTFLLDDPSPKVRLALAQALAPHAQAPRSIILPLSSDQPEIACTILQLSPVLTDGDLIDLARRGDGVIRSIIALRPDVSRPLVATIVECGNEPEVLDLLENPGASFSLQTLRSIANRYGDSALVRALLLDRADLPADVRHVLVQKVSAALTTSQLVQAAVGENRVRRVAQEAGQAATLAIAADAGEGDLPTLVEHLRQSSQITPAFLMHALCAGRIDFVAEVLCNLSGLQPSRVRSVLAGGRQYALKALFERAGIASDIVQVFVDSTLLWRRAITREHDSLVRCVAEDLKALYERRGSNTGAVRDLLAMVDKLIIVEQRELARNFAREKLLAA